MKLLQNVVVVVATCCLQSVALASGVINIGPYPIQAIYQSQVPGVGAFGMVTPGTTGAALVGNQVVTVALPAGPASPALFTMPGTIGGSFAFGGGFAVSNGTHILTGQTAASGAGEAYLTPVAGGATHTMAVNGIYDATVRSGNFYVSAAHGMDSFGDSTGVYSGAQGSGIYGLNHAGGTLTGLDLLFDTGTYSGSVAADPLSGDIYFALGGDSATLSGGAFNDLYVLKAGDIAAASGTGVIGVSSVDYIGSIGTGFDEFITGLVFDPSGALLVGLSGQFGPSGLDRIARFGVDRSNSSDYLAAFTGNAAIGSDTNVRIFDFDLDGGTLRVTAVPEPGSVMLLLAGVSLLARRRGWAA